MKAQPFYVDGGDNSVLRFALYEAWGPRCYWCTQPRDFTEIQIDHIIPKRLSSDGLAKVLEECGKPISFNLHGLHNLAPICTVCNGPSGKGALPYTTPRALSLLAKAERFAPIVARAVAAFGTSTGLARHLVEAAAADLTDPAARHAFLDHAPAVAQRLALLDESLIDVLTRRVISYPLGNGEYKRIEVALDAHGRAALTVLEEVCCTTLDAALEDGLSELMDQITAKVRDSLENEANDYGTEDDPIPPRAMGIPDQEFLTISVEELRMERDDTVLIFRISGTFDTHSSVSIVQDTVDGSGIEDLTGNASITGGFAHSFTWALCDPDEDLEPDKTEITSADCDTWTE
jgi:hypothetical protein